MPRLDSLMLPCGGNLLGLLNGLLCFDSKIVYSDDKFELLLECLIV